MARLLSILSLIVRLNYFSKSLYLDCFEMYFDIIRNDNLYLIFNGIFFTFLQGLISNKHVLLSL